MSDAHDNSEEEGGRKCCAGCRFDGLNMAQGYNILGTGRGPIVMSNIFLSTALIFLASDEIGCTDEVYYEETNTTSIEVMEECDAQVYGAFRPAALIANIAVISGLMSAVLMPVIGAIVDYTNHRWTVGVASAVLITLVQGIQIGTTSKTWFAMSILQALTGFFYQVTVLSTYAYLPDISRAVGIKKMTKFTATFTMVQFISQAVFTIVVIGLSMVFIWDDVMTAQASQAINTVSVAISFYVGWKLLPKVEARHILPEGQRLLLQGFKQNWNTAKRIQRDFKKSLRWYLLALIFAEATASAFTLVAVIFLGDKLGLSGTEIGIFFLVCLFAMVPGGMAGSFVTSRTNPNTSWRLSLVSLFGLGVLGGFVLTRENVWPIGFIWGVFVGLALGWHYPTENLFFSMIIPRGQEAELAGMFVYCTQILGWLPPLIFSVLVENDVDQGIGVMVVSAFALLAVALLSMAPSWPEIVEDVRSTDATDHEYEDDNNKQPEDNNKNSDTEEAEETEHIPETTVSESILPPVEVHSNQHQTEIYLSDDTDDDLSK